MMLSKSYGSPREFTSPGSIFRKLYSCPVSKFYARRLINHPVKTCVCVCVCVCACVCVCVCVSVGTAANNDKNAIFALTAMFAQFSIKLLSFYVENLIQFLPHCGDFFIYLSKLKHRANIVLTKSALPQESSYTKAITQN